MIWKFDQAENAACITCRSVLAGAPVLVVTHYADDHSWAFLDGEPADFDNAMVVAMSRVVGANPDLVEIADLAPGWSAMRSAAGAPWSLQQDDPELEG